MYKCTAGVDKDWNEYGFTSCLFAGAEADAGAGAEVTDDEDSEETLHLCLKRWTEPHGPEEEGPEEERQ